MNPFVQALSKMASNQIGEKNKQPMVNPATSSGTGDTIYLPKDLFPGKCSEGMSVKVIAKITSKGDKIGLTPEKIEYINNDEFSRDSDSYGEDESSEPEPAENDMAGQ